MFYYVNHIVIKTVCLGNFLSVFQNVIENVKSKKMNPNKKIFKNNEKFIEVSK